MELAKLLEIEPINLHPGAQFPFCPIPILLREGVAPISVGGENGERFYISEYGRETASADLVAAAIS